MHRFFKKKKAYLIKWERDLAGLHQCKETVVRSKCEADAVWKFLQFHNVKLENLEILNIKEVDYCG